MRHCRYPASLSFQDIQTNFEIKIYNRPSVLWETDTNTFHGQTRKDFWNEIVDVLIQTGRTCLLQNAEAVNISTSILSIFHLETFLFHRFDSSSSEEKRYRFYVLVFIPLKKKKRKKKERDKNVGEIFEPVDYQNIIRSQNVMIILQHVDIENVLRFSRVMIL